MALSGNRSRHRSDPAPRRRVRRLASFDVVDLTNSGGAVLHALCRDGAVLLRPAADERLSEAAATCFEACSGFFARPFSEKTHHYAASGVGQAHGYMDYLTDDEGSECFEAKLHYDRRFCWPTKPTGMRAAVEAAADVQRRSALMLLDAIVRALPLDVAHIDSLLDARMASDASRPASRGGGGGGGVCGGSGGSGGGAASSTLDLEAASHTAMRVWQYTHGRPSGWHCDNTLLTLAPRGSSVGLQAKSPVDGASFEPEALMDETELLAFAGDALSFLTAGRVPALMHCVVPPPPPPSTPRCPASAAPAAATQHGTQRYARKGAPRLSCPFFLRARRGASLRPLLVAAEHPPPPPPLLVAELEHNAGNLRSRWPWKLQGPHASYYQGTQQTWHAALDK